MFTISLTFINKGINTESLQFYYFRFLQHNLSTVIKLLINKSYTKVLFQRKVNNYSQVLP